MLDGAAVLVKYGRWGRFVFCDGTQVTVSVRAILIPPLRKNPPQEAVLGWMQLTLHATRRTPRGASRLVLAMSASSVKTGRAPSRHRTDARVYGPTTKAMHVIEYPPPSSSSVYGLAQAQRNHIPHQLSPYWSTNFPPTGRA